MCPMNEEEKIMAGILFCPGDPMLRAMKLKTHNLNVDYNGTHEDETEKRAAILPRSSANSARAALYRGLSPSITASTQKSASDSSATSI